MGPDLEGKKKGGRKEKRKKREGGLNEMVSITFLMQVLWIVFFLLLFLIFFFLLLLPFPISSLQNHIYTNNYLHNSSLQIYTNTHDEKQKNGDIGQEE